ncbi:MAG TPA: deoxyribonuclease IV [Candidatus Limnocylindrales bacterium]|nr:deoxyribonuclease IV [Candidatus Limnocylindrales bacterium]
MLPDGRRLGAHLPLGNGMVRAAERAHAIGATALQIFGDNPTAWRRRAEPPGEQEAFRGRIAALGIGPVAVHAAYLVNLAGPDVDFFERSVAVLAHELRSAPGFGARFVNVHTGSHRDTGVEAGVARLAGGVQRALDEAPSGPDAATLVLENPGGGGFAVGATIEELADIAEAIARRGVADSRVAFCLDVAHLWAAGYRLSDPGETDAVVDSFDRLIGLERLALIHLNDSKTEVGSRLDRHEHVGAGGIGEAGIAHLLTHPRLRHVAYILETPGMDEGYDAVNMARARALARGLPLDPLPPEAMNLRGSRARTAPQPEPV